MASSGRLQWEEECSAPASQPSQEHEVTEDQGKGPMNSSNQEIGVIHYRKPQQVSQELTLGFIKCIMSWFSQRKGQNSFWKLPFTTAPVLDINAAKFLRNATKHWVSSLVICSFTY